MSGVSQQISQLREDFMKGTLSENDVLPSPDLQFDKWMSEAVKAMVPEAQAFNLATVSAGNKPSSRVVYLREFGNNHFYFYTNYHSHKAQDLAAQPHAAMCFFWPELERQVRIEGTVEKADASKSDAYFRSRPQDSKIGAWSSPQSQVIAGREALEENVKRYTEQFGTTEIVRPEFWGGYMIKAQYYEFWQGRKSRLHDRIRYTWQPANGSWLTERLAP